MRAVLHSQMTLGEDDISSITSRIENYAQRVKWVKSNADVIVQRIVEKMNL